MIRVDLLGWSNAQFNGGQSIMLFNWERKRFTGQAA